MTDYPYPLLYRDGALLAVNKPAGLLVHPVAKDSVALTDQLHFYATGGNTPMPMHRLDRETSGVLLLGATPDVRRYFERLFRNRQIKKTYWALVMGQPPEAEGVIDAPLLKHQPSRRMIVSEEGAIASTHYKVRHTHEGISWVELTPHTGRTHQLRAHCRALGCPVMGDALYQDEGVSGPLQLHARKLEFEYPDKKAVEVLAPPPEHMALLLAGF